MGLRVLELFTLREKLNRREIKLIGILQVCSPSQIKHKLIGCVAFIIQRAAGRLSMCLH